MTGALRDDPVLGPVVDAHGPLTLEPADDPFRRLVVAILNQQLSTASAAAIRERLFARVEIAPGPLLDADPQVLRAQGLSASKTEYVRNVAAAFADDRLSAGRLAGMTDQRVIDELTAIRGVGVWTAKMFLIFALARPDVFPVEDLGVRGGMTALFGELTRREMVDTAERWRPHRSTASLYLWRVAHADGEDA